MYYFCCKKAGSSMFSCHIKAKKSKLNSMKPVNINVPLLLPEYGRNVQKMVKYLLTIEGREERNKQAQSVLATMANVYPHTKSDTEEFRHMLYDHLFMISGFQLDIDCEFDAPTPEQFAPVPQRVPYTQQGIVRKQYGSLVPRVAREIAKLEDKEQQRELGKELVMFMRQKAYDYNDEFPSNELILADLFDMSNGAIELNASVFDGTQLTVRKNHRPNNNNKNKNGHQQRQNNNNNKYKRNR